MRKTIVNQRRIMEQLQQQFVEALKQKEEIPSKEIEVRVEASLCLLSSLTFID